MIQLESQSSLTPDQVLDQAVSTFGPQGLGLMVSARDRRQVHLVGGGGSVTVTATRIAPRQPTTVQVHAKEWEQPAKQFLTQLRGQERRWLVEKFLRNLRDGL